jgi:hypothetical protein
MVLINKNDIGRLSTGGNSCEQPGRPLCLLGFVRPSETRCATAYCARL